MGMVKGVVKGYINVVIKRKDITNRKIKINYVKVYIKN